VAQLDPGGSADPLVSAAAPSAKARESLTGEPCNLRFAAAFPEGFHRAPPASVALPPRLERARGREMSDLGGGGAVREKAIHLVKDAVEKDKEGNYPQALKLYMSALDNFTVYLKYEKNPRMQDAVKAKFTEYLERAEEIKALIDGEKHHATTLANPHDSPNLVKAKPKAEGGGGESEEDAETSKMQTQLGDAIITEKPNVR